MEFCPSCVTYYLQIRSLQHCKVVLFYGCGAFHFIVLWRLVLSKARATCCVCADAAEATAGQRWPQGYPETIQLKPLDKSQLKAEWERHWCVIFLRMVYVLRGIWESLIVLYPREHCAESLTQKSRILSSSSGTASESVSWTRHLSVLNLSCEAVRWDALEGGLLGMSQGVQILLLHTLAFLVVILFLSMPSTRCHVWRCVFILWEVVL